MVKRHKPENARGVSPDQDFVQILDRRLAPARSSWRSSTNPHYARRQVEGAGHGTTRIDALWNEYVPRHLLTRLHGYELLMAPYAIAHLKIGLKLYETATASALTSERVCT